MRILTAPLVGAKFRPPAVALLEHLPRGAELSLEPEPDNPYDSGAMKVLVAFSQVPESEHAELAAKLPQYGHALDDIQARGDDSPVFLGYVASSATAAGQKAIAASPGQCGNQELGEAIALAQGQYVATLGFQPSGLPCVVVTLEG